MASANPFSKIVSNRQAAREAKSDEGKHLDASSQGRDGHATTQTPPPDANAGVSHAVGSATTPAHAAGAAVAEAAGLRSAEVAADKLGERHDQGRDTTHPDPEHTDAPKHGAADASGDQHHASITAENTELADAAATANAQLERLEQLAGVAGQDPTGGRDGPPQSPADRLADAQGSASGLHRQTTQEALQAASGEDPSKGDPGISGLFGGELRDAVRDAVSDPGSDAVTSAIEGVVDEAAHSASTNPLSVAADSDGGALRSAINSVTPADIAKQAAAAGVTTDSDDFQGAEGEKETDDGSDGPGEPDSAAPPAAEKGIVDSVVDFLKTHVATSNVNEVQVGKDAGGDAILTNTGTTTTVEGQDKAGIHNLETDIGKALGGASNPGKGGSSAGGGVKLTDPNSDSEHLTAAQMQFVLAVDAQLHIGPGFQNPGFIDPGSDETGSTVVGGPVDAATIAAHSAQNLLGNPGNPDANPQEHGALPSGGFVPGQHDSSGLDPSAPQGDFNTGPEGAHAKADGPESLGALGPGGGGLIGLRQPVSTASSDDSTSSSSDDSSSSSDDDSGSDDSGSDDN